MSYFDKIALNKSGTKTYYDVCDSTGRNEIKKRIISYNTVNDMKADTSITNGITIRTNGYHSIGDNGDSYYTVTNTKPNDMYETLNNGLYAKLEILESTIKPEQLGAYGDNIHDDTTAIQEAIDLSATNRLTVLFNNKIYKTTKPLVLKECCSLYGGVTNDEYGRKSVIKNNDSNMFTLTSNITGAKIQNLCLSTDSDTTTCFYTGNFQLQWCCISDVGIVHFNKAFDASLLGVRMYRVWINHGYSMGVLNGSDNVFKDFFVSVDAPKDSKTTLLSSGGGLALSRFENMYFTGRYNDVGCYTMLYLGGYCNNLSFTGCYFDFSFGSAVVINGAGNEFPKSGGSGIVFDKCLFRGNCTDSATTYNVIELSYCRNVTIIGCSFLSTDRYTVNKNSKLYSFNEYAQGVVLEGNLYDVPFTTTGSTKNAATIIEPYPFTMQNIGVITNKQKIYATSFTGTTDATYGSLNIPLNYSFGDIPVVNVNVHDNQLQAYINSVTKTLVEVIIRGTDGQPYKNGSVTVDVIACGNN